MTSPAPQDTAGTVNIPDVPTEETRHDTPDLPAGGTVPTDTDDSERNGQEKESLKASPLPINDNITSPQNGARSRDDKIHVIPNGNGQETKESTRLTLPPDSRMSRDSAGQILTPVQLPEIKRSRNGFVNGSIQEVPVSPASGAGSAGKDGGWNRRRNHGDSGSGLSSPNTEMKPKRAILQSSKRGKKTRSLVPPPEPFSTNFSIQNGRVPASKQQATIFKEVKTNRLTPRTSGSGADSRTSTKLPSLPDRRESSDRGNQPVITNIQNDTLSKRSKVSVSKIKAKLSKSETNFVRLAKMVTRVGSDLLRLTFYQYLEQQHPPKKLHQFLAANKKRLKSFASTYKLISRRWDIMYPDDDENKANLQTLDSALIFWFLRYICHLKRPNDFIWKRKPAADDFTETGNIARIRDYRNFLINLSSPALYEGEFQRKVEEFIQITIRVCGEKQGAEFAKVINDMKTEVVRFSERDQYLGVLNQWADETGDRYIAPSKLSADAVKERKEITVRFLEKHRNPSVFVQSKIFDKANDKLSKHNSVILKGNSGDGKTTSAVALMVSKFDEDECLLITSPEQWQHIEPRSVSAVLLDDIFGSGSFDEKLFNEWEPKFDQINEVTMETKERGDVKVIITIRHHILEQCWSRLAGHQLFSKDKFVDCSSSELTVGEKRTMLARHLVSDNKTLAKSEIEKSAKIHVSRLGFPQCCALYVRRPSFLILGSQFFEHPVDYLFDQIDRMYDGDKYGYLALAIMMFQKDGILFRKKLREFANGEFRDKFLDLAYLCNIPHNDHVHKFTLNALQNQVGSFVNYYDDRDCFTFSHESVMEAMMTSFGERHPQQVLEGCSLQFLMDVVGTNTHYKETTDDIFIMRVKKQNYVILARVLEHYISKGEVKRVAQHRSFRDPAFLQFFFEYVRQMDDMVSLILSEDNNFREKDDRRRVGFLFGAIDQEIPNEELASAILDTGLHISGSYKPDWCDAELQASLCMAVRRGNYDIYKRLADTGIVPPDRLMYEEQYLTSVDIVRDLLSRRHWSAEQKDIAVVRAARGLRTHSQEIVTLLLQDGAAVNSIRDGTTALCEAVKSGKTKTVSMLLASGASVMDRDATQQTPLHHACDWNNIEVVKLLLKRNADVNAHDSLGFTPFLVSAGWGRVTILELLMTKRIDPLAMDSQENTVLHICAANGQAKIMKIMVEKFPSEMASILIARNRHGWTPLDFALRCGHFGATKLLIQQILSHKSLKTQQQKTFVHTRFYVVRMEDFDISEKYQYRFLDETLSRTCFQMPRGNWFIQAGNREEYEQVRLFAQKYENKLRHYMAKT